jgi:hypothetical protein
MTRHTKGSFIRLLVAATGISSVCGASGGTVGFWSFDDGTPTNTAAVLTSATSAPALNAAAACVGTGKAPRFDASTPGTCVRAGLAGTPLNIENSASLRFVNAGLPANTNSNDGGCATVTNNALLRATNLTVEAFVKVNRHVNWPLIVGKRRADGSGTSWNLDLDNAGKPRVRIDSQPVGATGGSGWNQTWASSISIEDGKWHHLAFTYCHTNKAIKLYVDYVQSASGNSASNLVYDASELRIGQGCGDRAFDGWIDALRITDEVLAPEQFATVAETSITTGYWPFDDGATGLAAGTLTNAFNSPFLHGTAAVAFGGVKPTFAAEIPPNETRRISDCTNGPVVNVRNTAALHFVNAGLPGDPTSRAGGQVTIPGTSLPAQATNFTAEAFVKVDRHVNFPQIIGKTRQSTGGLSWSLALNSSGTLRARFDTQIPPGSSGYNQYFESTANIEDGQWHHVALTYDASASRFTLYKDYKPVLAGTTVNPLYMDGGDVKIGNGDKAFDGWIDEVRLTGRVLTPAEFLYTVPVVGSVTAVQ